MDWFKEFSDAFSRGKVPGGSNDRRILSDAVYEFHHPDMHALVVANRHAGYESEVTSELSAPPPRVTAFLPPLCMPFPRCWYFFEDLGPVRLFASDSNISISAFHLVMSGPDLHASLYVKANQWECYPVYLSIHVEPDETRVVSLERHANLGDYAHVADMIMDDDRVAAHCSYIYDYIMALTYILAQPQSHNITAMTSAPSSNQLRRARGLAPLPITREVRIDVTWLRRASEPKGGSHASPQPHMRKAHLRRLRNGTTVSVASCSVNGGVALPRTIARVDH